MRDTVGWAAIGVIVGLAVIIVWSTIRRSREDAQHREFMSAHGALMAGMEHAKARIKIGHATDDMKMIQAALLDLQGLKETFDGRAGIKMEVDVHTHPA